jgi:hypothetical protein
MVPDALVWLRRVDQWGPVRQGGYCDQPYYFLLDLEAAAIGQARADAIRDANDRLQRDHARRQG